MWRGRRTLSCMPPVLAWWLIPLGLTMIALGWALFRARPRRPLEIDEAIAVRNRVREALERPMPGQPARRLTTPEPVPVVEDLPALFPDEASHATELEFTAAIPVVVAGGPEVTSAGEPEGDGQSAAAADSPATDEPT